jgi:CheY-like chemotaxis protein
MIPILIDTANGDYSFLNLGNVRVITFPKPEMDDFNEDFDLDRFISKKLINDVLLKYDFNCLIIPFSLTDNFLEFVGLKLAIHVRLSKVLKQNQNVPIVFIGNQSPWEILRLTPLAEIISLEGSYWSRIDKELIEKAIKRLPNNLPGLQNRESFLDRINVEPPANYSSHHSIANEWSLLRWSEYIGADGNLDFIRGNLESLLYYKYLISIYGEPAILDKKKFSIPQSGKVLLVDDESQSGWESFYESFFSISPGIKFNNWNFDFKGREREDIVASFEMFFDENSADVVLLDLRLCDEDFNDGTPPNKLTGCEILKKIKKVNKGIQVIIVTASNKIWNYKELSKLGADGFITKESPEFNHDISTTAQSISTLKIELDRGLKDGVYLKNFWKKTFDATANLKNLEILNKISSNFSATVIKLLELSYYNVASNLDVRFATSFILYFNIVEAFCNELIDVENPIIISNPYKVQYKFRDGSTYLHLYKNLQSKGNLELDSKHIPWLQKILNTAFFLGITGSDLVRLNTLVDLRNDFIHQNLVNSQPVVITREDTKSLFHITYKMCMNIK